MPEKMLDTLTDAEIARPVRVHRGRRRRRPRPPAAKPARQEAEGRCSSPGRSSTSRTSRWRRSRSTWKRTPGRVRPGVPQDRQGHRRGLEHLDTCDVAVFFTRRLQDRRRAAGAVKKYVKSRQADRRHPHREPRVPELAGDGQGRLRRRLQGALRGQDRSAEVKIDATGEGPPGPEGREAVQVERQPVQEPQRGGGRDGSAHRVDTRTRPSRWRGCGSGRTGPRGGCSTRRWATRTTSRTRTSPGCWSTPWGGAPSGQELQPTRR